VASQRPAPAQIPLHRLALLVCFSGCAALIFQVAWMRELRLVFGATTAAVAAVLAIFMAGLGLGSAVLGRRIERAANPLFVYGALEAAIALSVAASPFLITLGSSIYFALGGQEVLGLFAATLTRLAIAAVVMAVPTFLMGGTLPAAVRAVTSADDTRRRKLAVLYGANTLGAVFGAAGTTLYSLECIGTRATLWLGCAIGLLVGALAISQSRKFKPIVPDRIDAANRLAIDALRAADMPDPLAYREWLIYFAAAVLGFAFFALELVWYRMLAPILGGTAFTFGLILCVALFGIGLGGIAYNYMFNRYRPTWSALAVTCGLEALFTIIPFALGDRLALMTASAARSAHGFLPLIGVWTYIIGMTVFPVALVSGIQFPLLIGLLGRGSQRVSEQLGRAYAWNTLGAIAGSLVAGFGALPLLGALGLWQAIAAALAVLSVIVLVGGPKIERRGAAVVAGLVVLTFTCMFAEGPTAAWRHSGIGSGRSGIRFADQNSVQRWLNEKRRSNIWEADGVECSVGLNDFDGLAFIVNGKSDGNSLSDASTQIGSAIVGAMLHQDPRNVLVIGLGTGESAGWFAEFRDIERVDVVEFEPVIDEVARRCSAVNCDVLNHPRVRRIYDDGREYVFTTQNTYDIIFSEPSNPYRAGVAALYTQEFYNAVRRRLNPGGIFVQWLQAYEVDTTSVLTVLATARSAFKYVEVWQTMGSDLQVVCSDSPIVYTAADLRARMEQRRMKEALAVAWDAHDLEGFLAHFVGGTNWVDVFTEIDFVPINTDERTILEYSFAKTVGRQTPFSIEVMRERLKNLGYHKPNMTEPIDWDLVELRRQTFNLVTIGQVLPTLVVNPEYRAIVEAMLRFQNEDYIGAAEKWPASVTDPGDDVLRLVLARILAERGSDECLVLLAKAETIYPADVAAVRAIYFVRTKDMPRAADSLTSFLSRLSTNPWCVPVVSRDAVGLAVDIANADAALAKKLLPVLSQPYVAHRYQTARLRARVLVAVKVGPQEVVDALAEMEPNVMWSAEILKPRAEAYAAIDHPLSVRAQRDWELFQRNEAK